MFKSLREKIQSLSRTQKNLLTVALVLFDIGILIPWISFLINIRKPPPLLPEVTKKRGLSEELKKSLEVSNPKGRELPEELKKSLEVSNPKGRELPEELEKSLKVPK